MKPFQTRMSVEEIYKINELQKLASDNYLDCKVWKMYDAFFEQAKFNHPNWNYQKRYDWSLEQVRESIEGRLKYGGK